MDVASAAAAGNPLIRTSCILVFFGCCLMPCLRSQAAEDQKLTQIKQMIAEGRWLDAVSAAESLPKRTADLDFYYGTALARLERWNDAQRVFQEGSRLKPRDERFPVELAGVEFKQKRYPAAAAQLRRALELAPDDSYANNFLASVYFLEGNLEAALKYWNRVGKPRISAVMPDPAPRINPALLDHALAFSPASTLELPDLLTSEARVRGLGIFSEFRFDLLARPDGAFDVILRNQERDGWGHGAEEILLHLFRGLPAQTVTPEYFNLRGEAVNIESRFRWDAQKRRAQASISGPFSGAKRHYRLGLDLRNENWNLLTSFAGPAEELGSFNLRREAVSADFTSFSSGRWDWSAGAELSHRDFRSVAPGSALTGGLLAEGFQLKQRDRLNVDLWRLPEKRMDFSSTASFEVGRIWSEPEHSFVKLQGVLRFHWLPRAEGDDYEIQHRILAGRTFGDPPVDEFFALGMLGDNDLWMRAHETTRDGKKGSGPMGRRYFISNWDLDKNVFHKSGIGLKIGPFVDTGAIADDSPALGSHKWLCDVGVQAKVRVLGLGVAVIFGKDLRSGNHALTTAPQ